MKNIRQKVSGYLLKEGVCTSKIYFVQDIIFLKKMLKFRTSGEGGGLENPDKVGQGEGGGLKIQDFGGRPK